MLHENTIHFLSELAVNNNKPWFDANRDAYQAAKENYEMLVGAVLKGLSATEPAFAEQKAKDCVFRIFRDVRFGKDKTPYKPNFGAFFSKGGRKFPGAGYYLHLEPGGKSFAGGGMWMPETPMLKAIRQEIDYNFDDFTKIITGTRFTKYFKAVDGEKVKTLPQGYSADNPAIEFLKLKSFTVSNNLKDTMLTSPKLADEIVDVFDAMRPFIDFLNKGAGIVN